MKNDLFFWCLFVWAFSVLLWGWLFLFAPMFVMGFLLKKTGVGSPLRKIIRPMTSRKIDKTISRGTY